MKIENSTIVITGASKGLGKETALLLAQYNTKLVLVARSKSLLKEVKQEIFEKTGTSPLIVSCDISSESEVDQMSAFIKEKFLKIDILINNAGFGEYRISEHISNQLMREHFEVNMFGAYYCVKALLPLLKQDGSGYILNIGSYFSKIALAENSVYAATKFALAGFTEGLCHEMKPLGIDVGLFLPGAIDTSFQDNRLKDAVKAPSFLVLNPKDVANMLVKMIRKNKRKLIAPRWLYILFKLKQSLA